MRNNIPKDDRVKIISDDFWNYIDKIGLNFIGKMYGELSEHTEEQHIKERMAKQNLMFPKNITYRFLTSGS